MPAINAHGAFTPTPENHMTPRPHPSVTSIGPIENEPRNLSNDLREVRLKYGLSQHHFSPVPFPSHPG